MKYTIKQQQEIFKTLRDYDRFMEFGKEEALGTSTINFYRTDILYTLIGYIGFYRNNQYTERASALESLTSHLITDTALPINYQSEDGLSLFDKATLIGSDKIQDALQTRYEKENQNRLAEVTIKFKQKRKRYNKK